MKLSRLKNLVFLHIARLPMPSKKWRPLMYKIGGVNIPDYQSVFIGEGVVIDTNHPELITIESGAYITTGCVVLAHFFEPTKPTAKFNLGHVHIGKNSFIGCNSVICNSITIGENAVIGAGSIVNKNIPASEIWAGTPVKFIKKRTINP